MSFKNKLVRWDITKRCNLMCRHCITSTLYYTVSQLTRAEQLRVVDILSANGIARIHLLGGEPLMVPHIMDIAERASVLKMIVSLNTNGYRLDSDYEFAKKMAALKVGVSFSLDGPTSAIHDKIRGRGSFDSVIGAASNYTRALFEQNISMNAVPISFYVTITPDNIDYDFTNIFEMATELKIFNIVVGILIPMGRATFSYKQDMKVEDILKKTELLAKISNSFTEVKLSFAYQTPFLLKYLNTKSNQNYGLCYSKCKSMVLDYHLQPDGALFPCVFLNEQNEKLCHFSSQPIERERFNILKNEFPEIIENSFFKEMAEFRYNKDIIDEVFPCNICPYQNQLDLCKPCAHHHTDITESKVFDKSSLCGLIYNREKTFYYE